MREISWESQIIVFITGMAIMTLEITGARILASFLGATIAVWTGIIGVILGAISLGYYIGGIIADKKLDKKTLSLFLFLSGLFIFLILPIKNYFLNLGLIESFSYGFQSFIYSLIFFVFPVMFLAAITVYVIRLETKKIGNLGKVNGRLYGISTIGSALGVFGTAFYFIPHFSTSLIILFISGALFLTPIILIFKNN